MSSSTILLSHGSQQFFTDFNNSLQLSLTSFSCSPHWSSLSFLLVRLHFPSCQPLSGCNLPLSEPVVCKFHQLPVPEKQVSTLRSCLSQFLSHRYLDIGHGGSTYTTETGTRDKSGIALFIPLIPPRSGLRCPGPTVLLLPHAGQPQLWVKITGLFMNTFGLLSVARETHKTLQVSVTMNS